jgi:hypothetical protein
MEETATFLLKWESGRKERQHSDLKGARPSLVLPPAAGSSASTTWIEVDKIKRGVYPFLVEKWEKDLDTVLRAASEASIDFGECVPF